MKSLGIFRDLLAACLLCLPASCQSTGPRAPVRVEPSVSAYSLRQVTGHPSIVFRSAEVALTAEGFSLATRDFQRGVMTTAPLAGDPVADGRYTTTRLGTRPAIQRIADLFVDDSTEPLKVYCRVVVQERATDAFQVQRMDVRTEDSPGSTPIERGAGTTRDQRHVWRTIRRDKRREREILEAIVSGMETIRENEQPTESNGTDNEQPTESTGTEDDA
ncbi:MAG: hypothetical protein ACYTHJ_10880 [Planctomycetota bacterium]|jgi:hypothetical protein